MTMLTVPERLSSLVAVPERLSSLVTVPERLSSLVTVPERFSSLVTVPERLSSLMTVPERLSSLVTPAGGHPLVTSGSRGKLGLAVYSEVGGGYAELPVVAVVVVSG